MAAPRASKMNAEPFASPAAPTYVGFWSRVFASIVDTILLMVVLTPITMILFGRMSGASHDSGPAHLIVSVIVPAMVVLMFWARRQATPGKMLVHARIVDAATDADADTGQLVLRYLGYYVSAIPFGLGFLWVAFDPRKQGWHDKIARTVVVRELPEDRPLSP